jgi:hypothetical protein
MSYSNSTVSELLFHFALGGGGGRSTFSMKHNITWIIKFQNPIFSGNELPLHNTYDINFGVGVSHVAYNTAILHLIHVVSCDNILVSCCCDDNVYIAYHLIQFHNTETVHANNILHTAFTYI